MQYAPMIVYTYSTVTMRTHKRSVWNLGREMRSNTIPMLIKLVSITSYTVYITRSYRKQIEVL